MSDKSDIVHIVAYSPTDPDSDPSDQIFVVERDFAKAVKWFGVVLDEPGDERYYDGLVILGCIPGERSTTRCWNERMHNDWRLNDPAIEKYINEQP